MGFAESRPAQTPTGCCHRGSILCTVPESQIVHRQFLIHLYCKRLRHTYVSSHVLILRNTSNLLWSHEKSAERANCNGHECQHARPAKQRCMLGYHIWHSALRWKSKRVLHACCKLPVSQRCVVAFTGPCVSVPPV